MIGFNVVNAINQNVCMRNVHLHTVFICEWIFFHVETNHGKFSDFDVNSECFRATGNYQVD